MPADATFDTSPQAPHNTMVTRDQSSHRGIWFESRRSRQGVRVRVPKSVVDEQGIDECCGNSGNHRDSVVQDASPGWKVTYRYLPNHCAAVDVRSLIPDRQEGRNPSRSGCGCSQQSDQAKCINKCAIDCHPNLRVVRSDSAIAGSTPRGEPWGIIELS